MQTYVVSGKYQIYTFNTTPDVDVSHLEKLYLYEEFMINKDLLDILACPKCKGAVKLVDDGIVCEKCELLYEIKDGIPVMLIDKATSIQSTT